MKTHRKIYDDKNRIGIVGLGLMGSSIATCLLAYGHRITALVKSMEESIAVEKRIFLYLKDMNEQGVIINNPQKVLKNLTITDDFSKLSQHELVIESIFESVKEKKAVYAQLERVLSKQAIIGSNTSAIPVSVLQGGMLHPQRLIGIHWAEPAHLTKFMEVICGEASTIESAKKVMKLASSWGKEPSLVKKDIKGFIANRLMYALMREAFHLVERGYADYEDIDRACRNDLGFWITFAGPFRFMDLTGIPAYLEVMSDLFPDLDNSKSAPETIKQLVSEGAKGVANNHGFYPYTEETAAKWKRYFIEYTYEISRLSEKYPQNIGDK